MNRKRGIYLASALLAAVMLSMLVGAALLLVRGTSSNRSASLAEVAAFAATSGLKYAEARLGENYRWRGDGNGVVVRTDDLVVQEDRGNVVGILRAPNGEFAQFRLRFNFQDDAQGNNDGLSNPVALNVDHPYASLNNLLGGSAAPVRRGTGPGFAVLPASPVVYTVPPGTACVIVEGRTGPGLLLSPDSLNPPALGPVTTRVCEAYLRANQIPGSDAVAMAAGNLTFNLGSGTKASVSSKTSTAPRIRSKQQVIVKDGASFNYESDKGEVFSSDGLLDARYDAAKVTTKKEDPSAGFYKLDWSKVQKATSGDPKMPAGTYVLWDDGTLHYYDMSYGDYAAMIQANPTNAGTLVTSLPSTMKLDVGSPSKPTIQITGNIFVEGTAKTTEFNLIPRGGAAEDPPSAQAPGEPGEGPTMTETQMVTAITSNLPPPTKYGPTVDFKYGTGQYATQWTLPVSSSFSSTITAELGSPGSGTWRGIQLKPAGPGLATLTLDTIAIPSLVTPPLVPNNPNPASLANMFSQLSLAGNPNALPILQALTSTGGSPPTAMQELTLPGVTTTLKPGDMEIEFKPSGGKTAILSADGGVRIGANLKGEGGSITSGGTIRVVGAGTDLQANVEQGLNFYAKGDVVLSSLQRSTASSFKYKNFKLKGVIYTWGNLEAKVGYSDPTVTEWGKFEVEGAVVAYGGDPSLAPGTAGAGAGAISVTAKEAKLAFDSAYLLQLTTEPAPGPLRQTFYTSY